MRGIIVGQMVLGLMGLAIAICAIFVLMAGSSKTCTANKNMKFSVTQTAQKADFSVKIVKEYIVDGKKSYDIKIQPKAALEGKEFTISEEEYIQHFGELEKDSFE